MPRTRDFFLFCLVVLILVLAIGVTRLSTSFKSIGLAPIVLAPATAPPATVGAVQPEVAGSTSYTQRIAALRAKLKETETTLRMPEVADVKTVDITAPTTTKLQPATTTLAVRPETPGVLTCDGYKSLDLAWNSANLTTEIRDGLRLYFEVSTAPALLPVEALASSSAPAVVLPTPVIKASLPVRIWPLPTVSCLPSDVIGIAFNGVLLRNQELTLYSGFSSEMIVGYSLDGFTIYGVTPNVQTDACGGAMVDGVYRYVLDPSRPGLITCFSGIPVMLQ